MKKVIILILLMLGFATYTFAAGSSNITFFDVIKDKKTMTISWIADASNATVPDLTIDASLYELKGWYLYSAETDPGGIAPTDNYDIVLNNTNGIDVAGGLLANRDISTTEMVNISSSAFGYPIVRGDLTFSLSNNATNSATGILILIFVPE
ncbi:MAG: hypothetical protein ACOYWZ_20185 [Bacillota bacterium]